MGEARSETLSQGRDAFIRRDWRTAYEYLQAADHEMALPLPDLERLAIAADLLSRETECSELWARAHREYLDAGDIIAAARCAFWVGLIALLIEGDPARGHGWQARGQRLLDDGGHDCPEGGFLLVLSAVSCLYQGDLDLADAAVEQIVACGERFHNSDLTTLGRLGRGQILVRQDRIPEGMDLFDEVMAAVTAGDVSPVITGIAYCAVLEECHAAFDLGRARLWTEALNRWSLAQPGLVTFRRQCLVHRAELMRFQGAWTEAQSEALRACEMVGQVRDRASIGSALYEQAEVYRLRGDYLRAEEAYRQASREGRTPYPGLALLRLAQGNGASAAAAIRRELQEVRERRPQAALLAAYTEIMLALGRVDEARQTADRLSALAVELDAPVLRAMALQAQGATTLGEADAASALTSLRSAWRAWYDLESPYEAARVRVLIGLCCRELGDPDSAELELDAASQIFAELSATPDIVRVATLLDNSAGIAADGLTKRELEVLRLVVAGKTNHAIATELVVSDHTVRRHVQNIFAKLGVSSRAAATAHALQHNLL